MLNRTEQERIANYRYHHFPVLESTNRRAFELLNESATTPLIVDTDNQTAGLGQHDRRWCSASGSLTFSIALKLDRDQTGLSLLPVVTGVAVCEAIDEVFLQAKNDSIGGAAVADSFTAKVKWPNDILIADRKVCGILVQTQPAPTPTPATTKEFLNCVIGIGINITDADGSLRRDVESGNQAMRFPFGDLQSSYGRTLSKSKLLISVSQRIESMVENFKSTVGREALVESANRPERIWRFGHAIVVQRPKREIVSGVNHGIADDGSLLLNCDGQIERICSGSILR